MLNSFGIQSASKGYFILKVRITLIKKKMKRIQYKIIQAYQYNYNTSLHLQPDLKNKFPP